MLVAIALQVSQLSEARSMTEAELNACRLLGEAWNAMLACGIANSEAAAHIHALQHAVMAQAARRMHPEIFR